MKFSANLGFLWTELSLPDAIVAAKKAGFDAVECHWPYDYPAEEVKRALNHTGLKMLGINTRRGNPNLGENGLSALPDRALEARTAIDEALAYANMIGTPSVHVMAGNTKSERAQAVFVSNIRYACERASEFGVTILIEPINQFDSPGYFLKNTHTALAVMDEVQSDNLKLMFDCYHIQRIEGNLCGRLESLMPRIGHIQFASVPDRGAPDDGEVNYEFVFKKIVSLGYSAPLGAEYRPSGQTETTLEWLKAYQSNE